MAPKEDESTVSLKIFVDKEKRRVVLAESDKQFVDILVSFLTLPMGTIIRLLGKQSPDPLTIGCMNNLYESVENLKPCAMWTDTCKDTLLCPKNLWAYRLVNLKVDVDDSMPKYYSCPESKCRVKCRIWGRSIYVSTDAAVKCSICGKLMNTKVDMTDYKFSKDVQGSVFVTGFSKFIITDDLQVLHSDPGNAIKLLSNLGIKDMKQLEERTLNVGLEDVIDLLKHLFASKTPLTDVFLPKRKRGSCLKLGKQNKSTSLDKPLTATTAPRVFSLKIFKRKSDGKVFFAEAGEDFVDFLFSFLTFPLGCVLDQLNGKSELGCIDNFLQSLKNLNSDWFLDLNQKIQSAPVKFHSVALDSLISWFFPSAPLEIQSKNPKAPDEGFFTRPTIFMISDDLRVTPLSYSVSFLKKFEFHLDDLEEHSISIGYLQALNLLKVSLISTTALTDTISLLVKKQKKEM